MKQKDLAAHCEVTQPSVVRWEAGTDRPTERAFIKLAELEGDPGRWWWLEQIGLKRGDLGIPVDPSDIVQIPLFKDRISAGPGSIIDERNVEGYIKMSRDRLPPHTGNFYAAKVTGDSMHPVVQQGFIVFIDTAQRDHKQLLNKMVAAREGDEIMIKWLRHDGRFFQLVPENLTRRNLVRILTIDKDVAIIGRVLMWIGEPRPD